MRSYLSNTSSGGDRLPAGVQPRTGGRPAPRALAVGIDSGLARRECWRHDLGIRNRSLPICRAATMTLANSWSFSTRSRATSSAGSATGRRSSSWCSSRSAAVLLDNRARPRAQGVDSQHVVLCLDVESAAIVCRISATNFGGGATAIAALTGSVKLAICGLRAIATACFTVFDYLQFIDEHASATPLPQGERA
jgi:hypothetical protein